MVAYRREPDRAIILDAGRLRRIAEYLNDVSNRLAVAGTDVESMCVRKLRAEGYEVLTIGDRIFYSTQAPNQVQKQLVIHLM